MLTTRRRTRVALVASVLTLALTGSSGGAAARALTDAPLAAAAAGADDDVTFTGHGWGHGRGMGQYGALGYAIDHGWTWTQILDHYYGGTTMGDAGNPEMTVELLGLNGKQLVVVGTSILVNGVAIGGTSARLTANANGTVTVERGTNCAGPWTVVSGTFNLGSTRVTTPNGSAANAPLTDLIRVCEASSERAYRGTLSVVRHNDAQMTINHVPTESYLRGVVPRESPASWGSLGGGLGMHALRAQAVAARSYALSGTRASGAKTCDTTACQVYGGAGILYPSGQWATPALEQAATDTAIAETAGKVRKTSGGAIARTEFSSSTGGYTAGGTFPAVADLGDSTASNPNHDWTTVLSAATVAANLGVSGIRSITVTGRNGLGADGGRVTQVTVVDSAGVTRTFTGNDVRSKLGLKSDWFTVSLYQMSLDEAAELVRSVYLDLFGREPDPSGAAHWAPIVAEADSVAPLVERVLKTDEWYCRQITSIYQLALARDPDPGGLASWTVYLRSGATVTEMEARVLGSAEALQTMGAGDVRTWVSALYLLALDRTAAPAEQEIWAERAAGSSRAAVALRILRSSEGALVRLNGYYEEYLERVADPRGQATFVAMLSQGNDRSVILRILRSAEYRSLVLAR